METTSGLRTLQGWTPVRFLESETGQPTVEWCQLGDLRLTAPFFLQTVQQARARNLPTRQTPADALTELAGTVPDLPLAGLVFHLSRCGSTLVTQMLASLSTHVVLSEPEPVDEVLRGGRLPAHADAARIGWLRGLAHAWGSRRFPDETKLLLKLDPWHVLDRDLLAAAWPGVPRVFLYRDPVEILVSQSDNLAGALFSGDRGPEHLGLTPEQMARMSVDEYCARALGAMAEAMAHAAAADPGICLVDYGQLPAAVETVIAPCFGLGLSVAERARMRQRARFHAKAPGEVVFESDSARKQRAADADQRELAARWIGPAHVRLEAMRRARARSTDESGTES